MIVGLRIAWLDLLWMVKDFDMGNFTVDDTIALKELIEFFGRNYLSISESSSL